MKSRNQLLESIVSLKIRQQIDRLMQPGDVMNLVTDHCNKTFMRILNAALQDEMTENLAREPYERLANSPARNGYKETRIQGFLGTIILKRPVVRKGTIKSPLLDAMKKAGKGLIGALASAFWLKGTSTRNTASILSEAFGTRMSATDVSRITDALAPGLEEWENRPVPDDIIYVMLDAFYLPVQWKATKDLQKGFTAKQAVLCALGINSKGLTREIGHLLGDRESEESWGMLVENLLSRGLDRSKLRLVVSDEHKGIIAAVEKKLGCPHQYCVFHKMKNVRLLVPANDRKAFLAGFKDIFWAKSRDQAVRAAGILEGKWSARYPRAVEITLRNLDNYLAFMNEPPERWRSLRTSNRMERYIGEMRRRLRPAGTIHSELELAKIMWSVTEAQERGWQTRRAFCIPKEVKAGSAA